MAKPSVAHVQPDLSGFQPKHIQLLNWIADPDVRNILAAGGVRSAKTTTILAGMFFRALRAPGSVHAIVRSTRASCKQALFEDSFPKTLNILLPGWFSSLKADQKSHYVDLSDLEVRLPNGSKFMFIGCDDPEKFRGLEFNTVFIDECNQIDYTTVSTLRGRLSAKTATIDGAILDNKMIFACNPTVESSWEFQVFKEGLVPEDRKPIPNFDKLYRHIIINAIDNKANLPASVFEDFEALPEYQRRRDEYGMWAMSNPNALFDPATIGRKFADPEDMAMIVVTLDPAGTSHNKSDSTGMIVAGKSSDGQYYVFEDATLKAKPDVWINHADKLRKDYDANWIVSEQDYARDILTELIARTIPKAPVRYVDSRGRGKRLRAEPIAALYTQGLVNHVPNPRKPMQFHALEQQMVEFDAPGFKGSPDRVDALVYALQFLSDTPVGPSSGSNMPMTGFWRR
jgi:PBSX family phage terminase large subunit